MSQPPLTSHDSDGRAMKRIELLCLLFLLLAGILPRLIAVSFFPTQPVSDFRLLVNFAAAFRDSFFAKGFPAWDLLNPGLPFFLSFVLRIVPASPEDVARWTTAILMGLVPLIPFVIWRGVFGLGPRVLAGLLLGLWPGHILFSGVVAQDNWVLMPTVALAALSVRSLILKDGGHPFWSACLFVLGAFIRQEMIVVLLPLAVVSAGGMRRDNRRNLLIWASICAVLLLMTAGQRKIATGRFALTTQHVGTSILGAYAPGTGGNYWIDPRPYIASVDPSLLNDKKRLRQEWARLVWNEVSQRPQFHLIRATSAVISSLRISDIANLYWSIQHKDVLSAETQRKAIAFSKKIIPVMKKYLVVIHVLFLTCLILAFMQKEWSICLIGTAIALKIIIHALIATTPRYFVPVTALEMLTIAVAAGTLVKNIPKLRVIQSAVAALSVILLLGYTGKRAEAYKLAHDDIIQRQYRFTLVTPRSPASLECIVDRGRLIQLSPLSATIEFLNRDPVPGEKAQARCRFVNSEEGPSHVLRLFDSYAAGNLPGRVFQRVIIDGKEVLKHDIAAEPGSFWMDIPLSPVQKESERWVGIEIIAEHPDPGCAWGPATRTTFEVRSNSGQGKN